MKVITAVVAAALLVPAAAPREYPGDFSFGYSDAASRLHADLLAGCERTDCKQQTPRAMKYTMRSTKTQAPAASKRTGT